MTARALAELAAADPEDAPAVVATGPRGLQPLLGCYQPEAAALLGPAAREATAPVRQAVSAIGPRLLELTAGAELVLFNVNSPEDLSRAEAILATRT